jgi:GDP-mannose transporter
LRLGGHAYHRRAHTFHLSVARYTSRPHSYNHLINGDLNILLVVFQAIAAVICVEFSKSMGWVDYPKFNFRTAQLWAPVNLLFCGMLFTGMASLEHNSVPMVTVFKNITNIMTTIGDCILYGASIEILVIAAFGIMLAGAVMAARNDADVTQTGLFWMLANCLCTSGYVLYLKYATKSVKLSKFGMVFYNNVLCSAFLFPVTVMNGEFSTFMNTKALHTVDYAVKNAFAGFVGFFLNFASLNCVAQTGPTTYAMIGSLNKIPIAIMGYLIFDSTISEETWTFISISLLGGFLYTIAKLREGTRKSGK